MTFDNKFKKSMNPFSERIKGLTDRRTDEQQKDFRSVNFFWGNEIPQTVFSILLNCHGIKNERDLFISLVKKYVTNFKFNTQESIIIKSYNL